MEWKQFLKPDWRKILITVVLGGAVFSLSKLVTTIGTQFTFFENVTSTQLVYPVIVLTDMIYWYLLSCLIFWTYGTAKKIKK